MKLLKIFCRPKPMPTPKAPASTVNEESSIPTAFRMVMNAHHDLVLFTLPGPPGAQSWTLLVDTNDPRLTDGATFRPGDQYAVTARSLLLLVTGQRIRCGDEARHERHP